MLKYVFDHVSQGKMKTGLNVICGALDKVGQRCDPSAELFGRVGPWMGDSLLHLAVVKRTPTAAGDAWIKRGDWINLGKVADPMSTKVIRLGRHWNDAWSRDVHAFVSRKWVGQVAWGGEPIPIHVSAPEGDWYFLDYFEDDIMEDIEMVWRSLTTGDGCVHCAYLHVLPGGPPPGGRRLRTLRFP